jgi:hypothetical protein
MTDDRVLQALISDSSGDPVRGHLPRDAISVADHLPEHRQKVIGWLSDPSVGIYFFVCIVWRTPGHGRDEWWVGLPGRYTGLHDHGWKLSHWRPL